MPAQGISRPVTKRARPWRCALFCLGLLLSAALPADTNPGDCPADRIDARVRVRFVPDGDTLILADGRKVRLIGINTPEVGHDGAPNEPGAIAARDQLRRILFGQHNQLALRYDRERKDRYGRLLAHAFLADGRNLTALLLERGAGFHILVPPNDWAHRCYRNRAEAAREVGRGVWGMKAWRPIPSRELDPRTRGYRIVKGRVVRIGDSRTARWINLEGRFALRLPRKDLEHFKGLNIDALLGRKIEVQGWIYARKGELRMHLRHPDQLRLQTPVDTISLNLMPPSAEGGWLGTLGGV